MLFMCDSKQLCFVSALQCSTECLLLQKYGVQVYFSGHDHNLEYIKLPHQGTHYIVSGAGSKCDRPFTGQTNTLFQWQSSGFVTACLKEDTMECQFYSIEDNAASPLYTLTVPRTS